MTYTINGIKYAGFTRFEFGRDIPEGASLVIANFDGDPELWIVENSAGMKALRDSYEIEWGANRVSYQEFIPGKKLCFIAWKHQVEKLSVEQLGCNTEFLPDVDYIGLHQTGHTPQEAVDYVRNYAKDN